VKLFHDIKFTFHRWVFLGGALIVSALMFSQPLWAATQQLQAQAAPKGCNPTLFNKLQPLYRNLKALNVYVDSPPSLQEALECRGREQECAKRDSQPNAKDVDRYIELKTNGLKKLNSDFPEVLYPAHLAESLHSIFTAAARMLPRSSSCEVPELTMLNPLSPDTFATTGGAADVLNVTLWVALVDSTEPHIVVLTLTTERQGGQLALRRRPTSTAIPLNLPVDEINRRVAAFISPGLSSPPIQGEY